MKLKLYTIFFIFSVLFFYSCKTAEKLYQKGRYDEAVELAAKKLAMKPNDASLLDILQNAYRFAVEDHETRIRSYANETSDLKWEKIYGEYLDLQRLYDAIHRSASVYSVVNPTDYSAYIATYKDEAANARIERGLSLMDNNTKKSYKDAYYEFQRALSLKPGDLAIREKMDEAFTSAVTNVVILPVNRYGYQYSAYGQESDNFNYDLLRYLGNNNSSPFVRYYSPVEADNRAIRTDNIVEMRFSNVNIGRYRDQRSVREVSRKIVSKETVYKPDSVVKEYITVKAKITMITRTVQADGLLQATIRDNTDRRVWSDTYRGDYNWSATFATYTGDERALSDEDKQLVGRREQWPPSDTEISRIIMNEIQHKTECGISSYFNQTN